MANPAQFNSNNQPMLSRKLPSFSLVERGGCFGRRKGKPGFFIWVFTDGAGLFVLQVAA